MHTEIAVLSLIHHPNVVQMKEVFESKDSIQIIMRLYPYGDLLKRLRSLTSVLTEATVKRLIWNLVNAVCYLHSFGIIHRDIKPENILSIFLCLYSSHAFSD